jgi:hypothetical protein
MKKSFYILMVWAIFGDAIASDNRFKYRQCQLSLRIKNHILLPGVLTAARILVQNCGLSFFHSM